MNKSPNPGSDEAVKAGCTCPVMDNHAGEGIYEGTKGPFFWLSYDCPLHGANPEKVKGD